MSKWIAEFELEDGDTMPEHMDLNYKGVKIDFHCKPLEQEPKTEWEQEPTTKNDLTLIHTEGLDEEIRCTMCTNSMKSDRGCDGSCVVNNDMYKAVMDVIEKRIQPTTKNDLGVDAISRADARSLICNTDIKHHMSGMSREVFKDLYNGMDELPSVTPQEPRWIPTSERLPEEDGEYYATVYDIDENYKYMDIAELENGIWQYKDYIKVLAWMPLPEPYKAESEDKA